MERVEKVEEVARNHPTHKNAGWLCICHQLLPGRDQLKPWIKQHELDSEADETSAFFARRDRDFFHLYYCVTSDSLLPGEAHDAGLKFGTLPS